MPRVFLENNRFDLKERNTHSRAIYLPKNVMKVMMTKNGQLHMTIPKSVAQLLGFTAGTLIKWEYIHYRGIRVMWRNPGEKEFKENV